MRLEHLLNQYNDRVMGPNWYPFVGYMDSIFTELGASTTREADNRELASAQERLQYGYLENVERTLFQRLIAAELLSLLSINVLALERSVTALLERDREEEGIVAASLSAHLMFTLEFSANIGEPVRDARVRDFAQRARSLQGHQRDSFSAASGSTVSNCSKSAIDQDNTRYATR
jgi:hypothetical protein